MSDWQKIETAPEGERILLFEPAEVVVNGQTIPVPFIFAAMLNEDDQWWDDLMGEVATGFNPTHWMPLPPPPEAGEGS